MSVKKKITVQPGKKKAAIQRTPSRRTRTVSEEPTEVSEPTPATPLDGYDLRSPVARSADAISYAVGVAAHALNSLPFEDRGAALKQVIEAVKEHTNGEHEAIWKQANKMGQIRHEMDTSLKQALGL